MEGMTVLLRTTPSQPCPGMVERGLKLGIMPGPDGCTDIAHQLLVVMQVMDRIKACPEYLVQAM